MVTYSSYIKIKNNAVFKFNLKYKPKDAIMYTNYVYC